eukprot:Rmarinus@m.25531
MDEYEESKRRIKELKNLQHLEEERKRAISEARETSEFLKRELEKSKLRYEEEICKLRREHEAKLRHAKVEADKDRQTLERRVSKLVGEVRQMRHDTQKLVNDHRQDLADQAERIRYEEKQESLERERETMEKMHREMENLMHERESEISQAAEKSLQRMKEDVRELTEAHEAEIAEMKRKHISRLREVIASEESLRTQHTAVVKVKERLEETVEQLKGEVATLRGELESAKASKLEDHRALDCERQDMEARVAEAKEELARATARIEDVRATKARQFQEIEERVKSTIQAKDETISGLRERLADVMSQLQAMENLVLEPNGELRQSFVERVPSSPRRKSSAHVPSSPHRIDTTHVSLSPRRLDNTHVPYPRRRVDDPPTTGLHRPDSAHVSSRRPDAAHVPSSPNRFDIAHVPSSPRRSDSAHVPSSPRHHEIPHVPSQRSVTGRSPSRNEHAKYTEEMRAKGPSPRGDQRLSLSQMVSPASRSPHECPSSQSPRRQFEENRSHTSSPQHHARDGITRSSPRQPNSTQTFGIARALFGDSPERTTPIEGRYRDRYSRPFGPSTSPSH